MLGAMQDWDLVVTHLIDHAAREPGLGLVRRPADARAIVLLKPAERDLIVVPLFARAVGSLQAVIEGRTHHVF